MLACIVLNGFVRLRGMGKMESGVSNIMVILGEARCGLMVFRMRLYYSPAKFSMVAIDFSPANLRE
jgi:hypothetical protein